jgi:hypothetical protein
MAVGIILSPHLFNKGGLSVKNQVQATPALPRPIEAAGFPPPEPNHVFEYDFEAVPDLLNACEESYNDFRDHLCTRAAFATAPRSIRQSSSKNISLTGRYS